MSDTAGGNQCTQCGAHKLCSPAASPGNAHTHWPAACVACGLEAAIHRGACLMQPLREASPASSHPACKVVRCTASAGRQSDWVAAAAAGSGRRRHRPRRRRQALHAFSRGRLRLSSCPPAAAPSEAASGAIHGAPLPARRCNTPSSIPVPNATKIANKPGERRRRSPLHGRPAAGFAQRAAKQLGGMTPFLGAGLN